MQGSEALCVAGNTVDTRGLGRVSNRSGRVFVIPAQAGIQGNWHRTQCLDPGLRRDDKVCAGMTAFLSRVI